MSILKVRGFLSSFHLMVIELWDSSHLCLDIFLTNIYLAEAGHPQLIPWEDHGVQALRINFQMLKGFPGLKKPKQNWLYLALRIVPLWGGNWIKRPSVSLSMNISMTVLEQINPCVHYSQRRHVVLVFCIRWIPPFVSSSWTILAPSRFRVYISFFFL